MKTTYLRATDLPDDVRAAVCNGGGPAAGIGAWIVPDLLSNWTAAFDDHDAGYTGGGDYVDRQEVDQRMRRDLLSGASDWAAADGLPTWRLALRGVALGALVLAAVYVYYVAVRIGGGSRWLGSWKYRGVPASAGQVIGEVRAKLEDERKTGQR